MARDESRVAVGLRVHAQRSKLGMTHRDIAEAIGVSRMSVSLWERGEAAMSAVNLIKLSEVLKCDPIWIMTGMENHARQPKPGFVDSKDILINKLIKMLPEMEKVQVIDNLKERVAFYDNLFTELKASREEAEEKNHSNQAQKK